MNKSARQRAQELGLGVFQICEALHGSNNGSCDRLDNEKEKLYIDILESYLKEWVDYKQSILYDTAVKRLIEATITETKLNWSIYELVNYSNNRKRIKQVETPQI